MTCDIPYFHRDIPLAYLPEVKRNGWHDVLAPLYAQEVSRRPAALLQTLTWPDVITLTKEVFPDA